MNQDHIDMEGNSPNEINGSLNFIKNFYCIPDEDFELLREYFIEQYLMLLGMFVDE